MAIDKNGRMLLEAIKSMLQHDSKLGLSQHDKDLKSQGEVDNSFNYLHEQIHQLFMHKAAELTHFDGACAAFHKVHSYKYLNDQTFIPTLEREMIAQAIPESERAKVTEFIPKIISEIAEDSKEWAEKDSGFNPKLDEIIDISRPEQPLDFKVIDSKLNKKNVTSKPGMASPAKAFK